MDRPGFECVKYDQQDTPDASTLLPKNRANRQTALKNKNDNQSSKFEFNWLELRKENKSKTKTTIVQKMCFASCRICLGSLEADK